MSVNILENGQLIPVAGELYKGVGNLSFAGQIVMGANVNTPLGWLKCDGKAYDKTVYPDLYKAIGDTYNKPDTAADKFNVPDLAGKYVMGTDAENAVGSNIDEQLPNIKGQGGLVTQWYGNNNYFQAKGSIGNTGYVGYYYTQEASGFFKGTGYPVTMTASKTQDADGKTIDNPAYKDPVNGKPVKVRPDSVVLSYFIKF